MNRAIKSRLLWWSVGTVPIMLIGRPGCDLPSGDAALPFLLGELLMVGLFGLLLGCIGSVSCTGLRWAWRRVSGKRPPNSPVHVNVDHHVNSHASSQFCATCGSNAGDYRGRRWLVPTLTLVSLAFVVAFAAGWFCRSLESATAHQFAQDDSELVGLEKSLAIVQAARNKADAALASGMPGFDAAQKTAEQESARANIERAAADRARSSLAAAERELASLRGQGLAAADKSRSEVKNLKLRLSRAEKAAAELAKLKKALATKLDDSELTVERFLAVQFRAQDLTRERDLLAARVEQLETRRDLAPASQKWQSLLAAVASGSPVTADRAREFVGPPESISQDQRMLSEPFRNVQVTIWTYAAGGSIKLADGRVVQVKKPAFNPAVEADQANFNAFWADFEREHPGVNGRAIWDEAQADAAKVVGPNDPARLNILATELFDERVREAEAALGRRSSP